MITIPVRINVGGHHFPLQGAYDNKRTAARVLSKLEKDKTPHVVRHVEIAQKKLTLVYHA